MNLLTTFNLDVSDQRWLDILFCVSQNLNNPVIENIFFMLEVDENDETSMARFEVLRSLSEKCFFHTISVRPTFEHLFTFCNNTKNGKWIISNADIYFPKSNQEKLKLLQQKNYDKQAFVLTRYNILQEMKRKIEGIDISYDGMTLRTMHGKNKHEGLSIDSWIFETPFDTSQMNLNIELGQPMCDGMMNHQLQKVREVSNPCHTIISIHKHLNWRPCYKFVEYKGEDITHKQYKNIMNNRGHVMESILFSKLEDD